MSSLLTNGAAAGQRLNPNYLFLQAFGGVLSNKLEVGGGGPCCAYVGGLRAIWGR